MTTIAFDGVSICADTLVTAGGWRYCYSNKILRLADGSLLAFAGDLADRGPILAWVESGCQADAKPDVSEDVYFECLWLRGRIPWIIDDKLNPYEVSAPCTAGSGAEFAATAMMLGLSSREAVQVAIKMDTRSGGDIQEIAL